MIVFYHIHVVQKQLKDFHVYMKILNNNRFSNGDDTNYFGEYVIALCEDDGQYYLDRLVLDHQVGYLDYIVKEMAPGYIEPPSHPNILHLHWYLTENLLDYEHIISKIRDFYNKYLSLHLLSPPIADKEG